jgi:hypothetical protein
MSSGVNTILIAKAAASADKVIVPLFYIRGADCANSLPILKLIGDI